MLTSPIITSNCRQLFVNYYSNDNSILLLNFCVYLFQRMRPEFEFKVQRKKENPITRVSFH